MLQVCDMQHTNLAAKGLECVSCPCLWTSISYQIHKQTGRLQIGSDNAEGKCIFLHTHPFFSVLYFSSLYYVK